MDTPQPSPDTAPANHRSGLKARAVLEALACVRTAVNVCVAMDGEHSNAASTLLTIAKAALHHLLNGI
ncbi:hypothetical protein [Nocardia sp. NBC_00511]|uniref:hypothetical protein n=1 Tax=Nocardia sp. NBC_00511 TaxID=2903591 RepID=UPI002F90CA56